MILIVLKLLELYFVISSLEYNIWSVVYSRSHFIQIFSSPVQVKDGYEILPSVWLDIFYTYTFPILVFENI